MNKKYQTSIPRIKNAAKRGFTLIELLVVVLIIGILAAVALPQYEVAVAKSRFASMIPIVHALADAQEVYYMENGKYATSFDELAVQPPGGGVVNDSALGTVQYRGFYCRLRETGIVYCHHERAGYYRQNLHFMNERPGERFCIVYGGYNDELKRNVCRSYGGTQTTVGVAEAWTMP